MSVSSIPRCLTKSNIDKAVSDYLNLVSNIPLRIESDNFLGLMKKLKRGKIATGPYPEVSIFEAANRIMSDLVILFGVRDILQDRYKEFASFDEFTVELGNEKANAHDIYSKCETGSLAGEAFNVAPSFFHGKSSMSVRKLLANQDNPEFLIILCNSDCYSFSQKPLFKGKRVRVIPVDVVI
ncbi:hypothetical protein IC229_04275 [Spirosoma sp. BT702]|uniref:Uncharacterized protein n=1 Tax=Spirosoma profusum TaxID=2771354 RepID=A0A927AMH4_9BACT|nr:hypothetical protein [Spirosoma profusum]MBD2699839.1 hypothetical protein [Spirosoma profusum]